MTVLATDAFRPVGPGNAIPNDYVVPYYLPDRKRADLGRACRRSPLRVRRSLHLWPLRHARSPGACSRGRRSCANATALVLISPLERSSTARRPSHSTSTKCKRSKAAFMSEPNCDDRQLAVEMAHCVASDSVAEAIGAELGSPRQQSSRSHLRRTAHDLWCRLPGRSFQLPRGVAVQETAAQRDLQQPAVRLNEVGWWISAVWNQRLMVGGPDFPQMEPTDELDAPDRGASRVPPSSNPAWRASSVRSIKSMTCGESMLASGLSH